jgi:hypothetical protein
MQHDKRRHGYGDVDQSLTQQLLSTDFVHMPSDRNDDQDDDGDREHDLDPDREIHA